MHDDVSEVNSECGRDLLATMCAYVVPRLFDFRANPQFPDMSRKKMQKFANMLLHKVEAYWLDFCYECKHPRAQRPTQGSTNVAVSYAYKKIH